jgi:hypothetical protein
MPVFSLIFVLFVDFVVNHAAESEIENRESKIENPRRAGFPAEAFAC